MIGTETLVTAQQLGCRIHEAMQRRQYPREKKEVPSCYPIVWITRGEKVIWEY
jgi:hypothetical protein